MRPTAGNSRAAAIRCGYRSAEKSGPCADGEIARAGRGRPYAGNFLHEKTMPPTAIRSRCSRPRSLRARRAIRTGRNRLWRDGCKPNFRKPLARDPFCYGWQCAQNSISNARAENCVVVDGRLGGGRRIEAGVGAEPGRCHARSIQSRRHLRDLVGISRAHRHRVRKDACGRSASLP
jgi:hypothetical protein